MKKKYAGLLFALTWTGGLYAQDSIVVEIFSLTTEGKGQKIGTVTAKDTSRGTEFSPNLTGLSPGQHGFHVHQVGNCNSAEKKGKLVAGLAAKGHFDPGNTGVHAGPEGNGHLGDLPALTVAADGTANQAVVAPRLKVADLKDRALIIHGGGDNYSDIPKKLGGGGPRVACGVIGTR